MMSTLAGATIAGATLVDLLGGNEWCLQENKADDKDCRSCRVYEGNLLTITRVFP